MIESKSVPSSPSPLTQTLKSSLSHAIVVADVEMIVGRASDQ
jgi:hypothetical protein